MKYTVNKINEDAKAAPADLIARDEENYHNKLRELAAVIKNEKNRRIIMLAGPSGSGKTTSAALLSRYLTEMGENTQVVSLDDFYLEWGDQPKNSDGTPDFESVYALDIKAINRCFAELLKNGESHMPIYDFKVSRRSKQTKTVSVKGGGAVIIEGLHALNPVLYESIPRENIFKIYISVSSEIMDGERELIGGGRIRFIRRMLRDETHRNSSVFRTLELWQSVMKGERKYLVPFKDTADYRLDTLHSYELCVYKNRAERMLSLVPETNKYYDFAQRVLTGIGGFCEIPESFVPETSLLREFI